MSLKEEIRKAFKIKTEEILTWLIVVGVFVSGLVLGMLM